MNGNAFVLIVNEHTEDATQVLNLIEATREKRLITGKRELFLQTAIQLFLQEEEDERASVRKLVRLLCCLFDIRNVRNPEKTVTPESLETEIHKMLKERREKE